MKQGVKRLCKVLGRLIGAVAVVIVVVVLVLEVVLSPRVCTTIVNRYAPSFVDGQVSMSSVSISLLKRFPAVSLEMSDLVITYPSERYEASRAQGGRAFLDLAGVDRRVVKNGLRAAVAGSAVESADGSSPDAAGSVAGSSAAGNAAAVAGSGSESSAITNAPDTVCTSDAPQDTLASIGQFRARLNLFHLIAGRFTVRELELRRPRIYVHNYADGRTNLETIPLILADSTSVDDSSSFEMPKVMINRLSLSDKPVVVYTDQKDSLFAMLRMKGLNFDGVLSTASMREGQFDASLDSLMIAGRAGRDTLLFALDRLSLEKAKGGLMDLGVRAGAYAATSNFGRVRVPMSLDAKVGVRQSDSLGLGVLVRDLRADIATIPLTANCLVAFGDSLWMTGRVEIPGAQIQNLLSDYAVKIVPEVGKIRTDAVLNAAVDFEGCYDGDAGVLPRFNASVSLPQCHFRHIDYDVQPTVNLDVEAGCEDGRRVDVTRLNLRAAADGALLSADATASDVLGGDPLFGVDACLKSSLDSLDRFLRSSMGMSARGKVDADLSAKAHLSQLNLYKIGTAKVEAKVQGDDLRVLGDSLDFYADRLRLNVALMTPRFAKNTKLRTLGADLKLDSLSLLYNDVAQVRSKDIRVLAQCGTDEIKLKGREGYRPLFAKLDIGGLLLRGEDSLRVMLRGSSSSLRVHPSREDRNTTIVGISTANKGLAVKAGNNRFFVSNLELKANATTAGVERGAADEKTRKERAQQAMERIRQEHPDWNHDSIRVHMKAMKNSHKLPEWLSEKDFAKSDVRFDLGESFRNMYRKWNLDGSMTIGRVRVATPAFPMRTMVTDFRGSVTNDRISMDTLRLVSGSSDISAHGSVSNLRAVVEGRGITRLQLDIESDTLSLNELLNAYAKGQTNMKKDLAALSSLDDSNFERVLSEVEPADREKPQSTSLIVVPANVNANIHLHGRRASYANMTMTDMHADIIMKQRCLQITDLVAASNIGTLTLDAFYSTTTKTKVLTGFDLGMHDVSAEGAISLVPQIDTLMPLLRSFSGKLNCNVAATARLDTNMNVIPSSMDGVLRITGNNLHIDENKELSKMARMLMFKEPKNIHIDTMSVEGILRGENIEVFPFVLQVDRYCLAMAGVQRLDKSFNYHVSLIKSPLLVKLGANFYGPDFDDMHFKIGKALYRNPQVPVFSEVIDTTHLNLRSSIRNIFDKGVERAVRENQSSQGEIDAIRRQRGYSRSAAETSLEGLSSDEKKSYDEQVGEPAEGNGGKKDGNEPVPES